MHHLMGLILLLGLLPLQGAKAQLLKHYDLGPQVPEVELEARTMSYFRPDLLLEDNQQGSALEQAFQRRLRLALELAGTMEILDHRPDSSTWSESDWELLTRLELAAPDDASFPDGDGLPLLARLLQGGEALELQHWPLLLDPERLSEQAEMLASEVLYLLTGFRPAFGSQLLYVEPQGRASRLILGDFFGEQLRSLNGGNALTLSPAWSPDGTRFAMVVLHPDRGADIWTSSGKGDARPLLEGPESETAPAWSPDGRLLACALTREGNTDLYLLPMDPASGRARGEARRLTRSPGIDTNPAWSPDGRHLVFASDRSGSLQIYRIGVDGLDEQRISFEGGASDCPAWSPDGDWILFVSRERQGFQLFQMRPDGTDWIRLSSEPGNHFDPCWSVDGQLIAFNWQDDVWVARADGSERRRFSRKGGESPAWRP